MAMEKRDLPWTETNSDSHMRPARNVQAVQSKLLINVQPVRNVQAVQNKLLINVQPVSRCKII